MPVSLERLTYFGFVEVERVFLLLVFLLLMFVLSAAFYVGALFFQSYIYTQPVPGLAWRAPAAAALMAVYFTLWCLIVISSDAKPGNIPYDSIFRFNPKVDMFDKPAPRIWTIKADGTKTAYVGRKGDDLKFTYRDDRKRPYNDSGVVAVELEHEGEVMRFDKVAADDGPYRSFRSAKGWVMVGYESGFDGIPFQSRWGRLLGNLALNLLHAALWFVSIWLLLQFRFNDALGFTFVLWLATTALLGPVLLDRAAAVVRDRIAARP